MKKILIVLGGMAITILLVGVGWIAGFQSQFFRKDISVNVVDKSLTDLFTQEMLLQQIETGKLDDAKFSLRMQIDCDILAIDGLIDDSDERSRELARKIFTRIAQERAAFPPKSLGEQSKIDPKDNAAIALKIDSILKRASEPRR